MRVIKAVILAFSTYTRIPMPQVKWDDEAMKLAIAFLPLAGAAVGAAAWGWHIFCRYFGVSAVLFAAVSAALPVFITGGIHLDGYCDTSDALASWKDKDKRLEIMKDPHIGAFALIRCVIHILICYALFHELYTREAIASAGIWMIYPLSRCFAAWSAMTTPGARKDGMLAAFTMKADRISARVILSALTVLSCAGWLFFTFPHGIAGFLICFPVAIWYRRMALRRFGGITGDTTGYYLQITELAALAGTLFGAIWV